MSAGEVRVCKEEGERTHAYTAIYPHSPTLFSLFVSQMRMVVMGLAAVWGQSARTYQPQVGSI